MGRMREVGSGVTERSAESASGSFEDFFRAEHARLLRALFLVAGNEQEAEELTQEAFLKVWERWDRVRGLDDPTGYLYRTAMNAFRSRYRRTVRAARRMVGLGHVPDAFEAADERDAIA